MNRFGQLMVGLLVAAACSLLAPVAASAQTDSGRISGSVSDQTSGLVAGVKVTITDEKTGEVRTVETNADGRYLDAPLKPSTYTIKFEKPGFAAAVYTGMIVAVGQELALDVQIKAGAQEGVTVVGTAPVVSPVKVEASVNEQKIATGDAQTAESKWSVQVDGGATLGHSTSGTFGAEVDYRWARSWELAFEVGHMGNIASSALEDRAQIVGDALGVTATPTQSAIYYDLGVRFRLMPDGQWNPYLALGFGGSRVNTETDFEDADLSGVQLGSDLDGYVTKGFFMFGGGVDVPFKDRYFVDGSVRYGRVFANTGEIEGDEATTTFRLQVGVGVRF